MTKGGRCIETFQLCNHCLKSRYMSKKLETVVKFTFFRYQFKSIFSNTFDNDLRMETSYGSHCEDHISLFPYVLSCRFSPSIPFSFLQSPIQYSSKSLGSLSLANSSMKAASPWLCPNTSDLCSNYFCGCNMIHLLCYIYFITEQSYAQNVIVDK